MLPRSPMGLLHADGPPNVPTRTTCVVAEVCGEALPTNLVNDRPTSQIGQKCGEKSLHRLATVYALSTPSHAASGLYMQQPRTVKNTGEAMEGSGT